MLSPICVLQGWTYTFAFPNTSTQTWNKRNHTIFILREYLWLLSHYYESWLHSAHASRISAHHSRLYWALGLWKSRDLMPVGIILWYKTHKWYWSEFFFVQLTYSGASAVPNMVVLALSFFFPSSSCFFPLLQMGDTDIHGLLTPLSSTPSRRVTLRIIALATKLATCLIKPGATKCLYPSEYTRRCQFHWKILFPSLFRFLSSSPLHLLLLTGFKVLCVY